MPILVPAQDVGLVPLLGCMFVGTYSLDEQLQSKFQSPL